MSWIRNNFFPILTLFGIIVASIGAMISLPNTVKLLIGPTIPPYIYDTCRYEVDGLAKNQPTRDYDTCVREAEAREQRNQQARHIDSLIDGASALIVGLAIVAWSRRQDKR